MINACTEMGHWPRPEKLPIPAWRFSADLPRIIVQHLEAIVSSSVEESDLNDFCTPRILTQRAIELLEERQGEGVEAILTRERASETRPDNLHSFEASPTLEELAAYQGVESVDNFDSLLGDFWPEDETDEDFVATLRAWRQEAD